MMTAYTWSDIDECLVAALISVDLCENDTNTQCINIDGSHECVCVPGFERVNGTCEGEILGVCFIIISHRCCTYSNRK